MNRRDFVVASSMIFVPRIELPEIRPGRILPERPNGCGYNQDTLDLIEYLDGRGVSFEVVSHPAHLIDMITGKQGNGESKYTIPAIIKSRKLRRDWKEDVYLEFSNLNVNAAREGKQSFIGLYTTYQTPITRSYPDYISCPGQIVRYSHKTWDSNDLIPYRVV